MKIRSEWTGNIDHMKINTYKPNLGRTRILKLSFKLNKKNEIHLRYVYD
jgi:hypothetical protein